MFRVLGVYNFDTLMEKLRRKKSRVSEIDVLVQKQLYNKWNLPVIEFSNLKSWNFFSRVIKTDQTN